MTLSTRSLRSRRARLLGGVLVALLVAAVAGPGPASATQLYAATADNWLWSRSASSLTATWRALGEAYRVTSMTSGEGQLWAATMDNTLWSRLPLELDGMHWAFRAEIGPGIREIAYKGSPYSSGQGFYALGSVGQLLSRDSAADEWRDLGGERLAGVTALAVADGSLYATTADNRLLVRNPSTTGMWRLIGSADKVTAMTV